MSDHHCWSNVSIVNKCLCNCVCLFVGQDMSLHLYWGKFRVFFKELINIKVFKQLQWWENCGKFVIVAFEKIAQLCADIILQQILLSIALVQCSINQSVLALSEESVTVETFDGGQQEKLLLVLDYKTIFKGDHRPPYTCWLWKPNKYFRLYHQIQLAMKCSKTISDLIMKNRCSYCNIYC